MVLFLDPVGEISSINIPDPEMGLIGLCHWRLDMIKKIYKKPELKTCKMELGVFGSYEYPTPNDDGKKPSNIVSDYSLRME